MKFISKNPKVEEVKIEHPDYNEVVSVEEPQDLNSTAFSLTRNPEGGFALVTVKYNPITMLAKVETVKKVADSREEAEYYFRVAVGEWFGAEELKS